METLIAKYHLHPIIDHFTIALLGIGVLADVAGYAISALLGNRSPRARSLGDRLRGAALVLLVPGAISAIFSRFTGESEARAGLGRHLSGRATDPLFRYRLRTVSFSRGARHVPDVCVRSAGRGWRSTTGVRARRCSIAFRSSRQKSTVWESTLSMSARRTRTRRRCLFRMDGRGRWSSFRK